MRQLHDVERDLRNLAKDLSISLKSRFEKCASKLQSILGCIDIDCIVNLLVGVRKPSGYPSLLREEEFVEFGKDEFKQFFKYICSLRHVKELQSCAKWLRKSTYFQANFIKLGQLLQNFSFNTFCPPSPRPFNVVLTKSQRTTLFGGKGGYAGNRRANIFEI